MHQSAESEMEQVEKKKICVAIVAVAVLQNLAAQRNHCTIARFLGHGSLNLECITTTRPRDPPVNSRDTMKQRTFEVSVNICLLAKQGKRRKCAHQKL